MPRATGQARRWSRHHARRTRRRRRLARLRPLASPQRLLRLRRRQRSRSRLEATRWTGALDISQPRSRREQADPRPPRAQWTTLALLPAAHSGSVSAIEAVELLHGDGDKEYLVLTGGSDGVVKVWTVSLEGKGAHALSCAAPLRRDRAADVVANSLARADHLAQGQDPARARPNQPAVLLKCASSPFALSPA